MDTFHGTTIVCVRRETPDGVQVAIGGDGQVTLGNVVVKGTAAWVAGHWTAILGGAPTGPDDDFFDLGGGSLTAAQLVSRLRERFPEVTVADVYDHPGLADLAAARPARLC